MSTQAAKDARRLALQITTQLPDDEEHALEVLRYARELITFVSKGKSLAAPILSLVQNAEEKLVPAFLLFLLPGITTMIEFEVLGWVGLERWA